MFYAAVAAILLVFGLRTPHPYLALAFFAVGLPLWTFTEYTSHRWVFHRHWKRSEKWYKKAGSYLTNKYLDPTHFGHHEKPFDGTHINGRLRDLMPIFVVVLPVTLLFPMYTLPMVLGGVVLCYILEEWIHHCEHFYHFNNRYFLYVKKYHLYHHSSQGFGAGYGITNPFWDVVFGTRFSKPVRDRLFGASRASARSSEISTESEVMSYE
jgi:4-hydroxysphinganine ceramide fatty acyl 2-hydroxylase